MIGISLLTLDPWTVGGTQTYARELVRALSDHGSLEYRVCVSRIASDAGGALPTSVVPEFPASRNRLGRVAGLTRATLADGRLRRALGREHASAFHFPLTVMLPRVDVPAATTIHDLQHEAFPQFFSRPQLMFRRHVYGRSVRASRIVIAVSKHVRDDLVDRLGYPREQVRVDLPRRRPRALHTRRAPAGAVPALSRELVGAQEPRAAAAGVRPGAPGAPRAPARPDGLRPSRRAPRRCYLPRARAGRAAGRPVSLRLGAGLPQPVRGLRAPGPGGDGVRLPGRRLPRRRRSRRSAVAQPSTSIRPPSRTSRAGSPRCSTGPRAAASSARRASPGTSSHGAMTRCTVRWPASPRPADDAFPLHHAADVRERVLRPRRRGATRARPRCLARDGLARVRPGAASAGHRRTLPGRRRRRGRRAGRPGRRGPADRGDVRHAPHP